jgi:hypothetical protein
MNGAIRVYGLDFTSAPSSGLSKAKSPKRLMLAVCTLENGLLKVDNFEHLNGTFRGDFSKFEAWLRTEGEWIAGLDFPFGQPARLIADLNWPKTWAGYVSYVNELGKKGFERALTNYKLPLPAGQKELRRETDGIAGCASPMKLFYVPVGKMFFQGAPHLLHSDLSIHPVRIVAFENRHVIEAYPKLVAQRCVRRESYKSDNPKTDRGVLMTHQRQQIVNVICAMDGKKTPFLSTYNIKVQMSPDLKNECVNDPSGDSLDSVLCAIQAAWSYTMRDRNYGIPEEASVLEGWICDPKTFVDSLSESCFCKI